MYATIRWTSQFKKDYRLMARRGRDMDRLDPIGLLRQGRRRIE